MAVFDAVMRHGSVTAAAKALAITQPGASRTLAEAETVLGLKLFVRAGRGLRPTAEAVRLHAVVRRMHEGLSAIGTAAARLANGTEGTLRLIALPVLVETWVAAVAARFAAARPQVEVTLETAGQVDLLRHMRAGAFDVGFCEIGPGKDGAVHDLSLTALRRGHAVIVAHPTVALPEGPLDSGAVAHLPRHRLPPDSPFERRIAAAIGAPSSPGGLVARTQGALLEAIAAGGNIAIVDDGLASTAAARGLIVRGLHDAPSWTVGAILPTHAERSTVATAFVSECR